MQETRVPILPGAAVSFDHGTMFKKKLEIPTVPFAFEIIKLNEII